MKVLSFSVIDILPALLEFFESWGETGKIQTMRPAWKKQAIYQSMLDPRPTGYREVSTKPRIREGEFAQIMWKCRSPSQEFCRACGKGANGLKMQCPHCGDHTYSATMPKRLGIVKIKRVYVTKMYKVKGKYLLVVNGCGGDGTEASVARWDGFRGPTAVKDMFECFDEAYGLNEKGRRFYAYQWRLEKCLLR